MSKHKYVAKTSREALRMVRTELGEDAVILSNHTVGGNIEITALSHAEFSGLTRQPTQAQPAPTQPAPAQSADVTQQRASATVAADAKPRNPEKLRDTFSSRSGIESSVPATAVAPAMLPEHQDILSEIKSMRDMMQEQIACLSWSDMQQRDPQRTRMLRNLLNAGFSPVLSRQLIDKMPATADFSWVSKVIAHNLRVAAQQEDVVVNGGVVALIGPTGVGKTTTTAKLAARAVVRYGADKVALLTTDSYRIGAHEQLRIYGRILGVEVHAVRDTGDLRLTLAALKHKHLVLIDTIGMGQRDCRVAAQTEMFDATGVQRLLLLNATSGGDTLEDVVRMYHGAGVIGCIPTKLDEALTLGAVLDVAVRHKLALHYVADGQRVPEDLHEVNLDQLLHRAFNPVAETAPFVVQELEFPALMAGLGAATGVREGYAA